MLLKKEHGVLAEDEQGNLRTAETTPFNMCLHPDGQTVVVGLGSAGLQVLELEPQASGPPSVHFAQGVSIVYKCSEHCQRSSRMC